MKHVLFVLFMGLSSLSFAAIESTEFASDELRQRYQTLVDETRCPKCQNQNLAGSDSPISADLRSQIRRLLHEGASDQDIADYLVARYGDYVLYRPRWQASTYALWFTPFVLLILAAVIVVSVRQRRAAGVTSHAAVDDTQPDNTSADNLLSDDFLNNSQAQGLNTTEQVELDRLLDTESDA